MNIRRFEVADAEAVSAVVIKTLRISNTKDYPAELMEEVVKSQQPQNILERAGWTHFYVVEDNEQIIGCGAIGPFWGKEDESSLFTIFVLPEYQGKGVARLIMETLEKDEYFLRAKRIEIPSSITGCQFYRKFGYDYKDGKAELDKERLYRLEKFRVPTILMIKAIERNDIPECVRVIKTSFMTVADEFGFTAENAPRFVAFATTYEKLFTQYDEEHRPMFGYFSEKGSIIGYYSLLLLENNECELNNLCVLPEYRHNNIGGKLFADACAKAKDMGCEKLVFSIVEENVKLRKWYEKHGAVHTDTKKFDFFPFTCGCMEKVL
ncbi:GNAT family N-acetyltransferase [Ruminococcus flavefaciens]|uniref:GNAT family N-acetyltransferase n=1 Tax=Ruminococcus flavefaciens TaxID=1265 RepID=UPI0026EE6863|nr:GNAT family N-acetyltransferase [Ruminococcus flavefaciens]MDD7516883.1 GNAT family N-acetyltransferase [Ruminococcus flavefaciens]MDY5690922.1 GNAT family N-acetyltransferase [Ruminococcus flavefaciens]